MSRKSALACICFSIVGLIAIWFVDRANPRKAPLLTTPAVAADELGN